jgi:hypothetical protein
MYVRMYVCMYVCTAALSLTDWVAFIEFFRRIYVTEINFTPYWTNQLHG